MIRPALLWLALLLAFAPFAPAEVVREHPDERLATHVREVVAAINRGGQDRLEAFVRARYGAEMLQAMPVEASAGFLAGVNEHKSPLELCCYHLSEEIPENMAVAYLRAARSDTWSTLQVAFDADDRVEGLMIVPSRPPDGMVDRPPLDEPGLARELDAYLAERAAGDEFSGVVLVAREGKILFEKAYGFANREHEIPNRADTRFQLGSMNKMFTAVAVAQLVERGLLSLGDPIGKHLPSGWVSSKIGRKVTVRQLLNHTSGLGDYLEYVLARPLHEFSALSDYREAVMAEGLEFEPGTHWAYSNTGFLLAGVIVAHVSGMDYFDYVRRHVYDPAGMTRSDHYDVTRPPAGLADGYWRDEGVVRKNVLFLTPRGTPAGGGYSTVRDLLAFDAALRSGKLVSAAMRGQLFAPDPERSSPGYGLGFMIHALGEDREVGHGGTFPGVSSMLAMFLDSGYTFVALSNGDGGAHTAYNKFLTLIDRVR